MPSEEFERLTASLRRELIAHSLIQPGMGGTVTSEHGTAAGDEQRMSSGSLRTESEAEVRGQH
jgi:hypothetical protein